MGLCINDKCTRCDVGYIIKDYIRPLMQAMTVYLHEYNMRLIETKCLNTAVMILVLFFGRKALKHTSHCDVHNVVDRHTKQIDTNDSVSQKLTKDILKKTSKRFVYYIMLTDGYFNKPDGTREFFPGHVFVIEKIPSEDNMFYYIYQSYIDQYTFGDFVNTYKSIKLSNKKVEYYLNSIQRMVTHKVWDEDFVKFWMDMTKVDTTHMLHGVPDNAFYICYRKVENLQCIKNVKSFVEKTLTRISLGNPDVIYGDPNIYDTDSKPLTHRNLYIALKGLLFRLENNMSSQVNRNNE